MQMPDYISANSPPQHRHSPADVDGLMALIGWQESIKTVHRDVEVLKKAFLVLVVIVAFLVLIMLVAIG